MALALLSGILAAGSFLLPVLWWVHYVALVPWIILLTRPHAKLSWLFYLLGAYTFYTMGLGPFSLFHKAVPFTAALFYAPFFLPFAFVVRRVHLRLRVPLTVLVPTAWVMTEWLRLRFSIGEVGLFPLGASQFSRTTLIQVADLTGVFGVTFLVASANGAIADLLLGPKRWGRHLLWPLGAWPALLILVLTYGSLRDGDTNLTAGPRIALIQPNATHYKDPTTARATFQEHLAFTRREIQPGSADLIVWPENAISVPIEDDPRFVDDLGKLAREQSARLVIGAASWATRAPPTTYTSAFYFSAEGDVLNRSDKLHLIPWAEYIPFESWLGRVSPALRNAHHALARRLLGYVAVGVPGGDLALFTIGSGDREARFAVPICFEVASGGYGRDAARAGADFLLNITSEGFFGPPVYVHMLAHSIFRAVENRIAVVRIGNHGISGFITPSGRTRSLVRGNETGRLYLDEGSVIDRVPLRGGGRSFYSRFGDLFAYLCVLGSLVLFLASFRGSSSPSESSAAGR